MFEAKWSELGARKQVGKCNREVRVGEQVGMGKGMCPILRRERMISSRRFGCCEMTMEQVNFSGGLIYCQ